MTVNKSEELLHNLAEISFLSLWAIPNPHYRKGKELCDLLVVCGTDIIIFSVKESKWNSKTDIKHAWPRWYKRAITSSVKQIDGAVRKLKSNQELFSDNKALNPIEINIPDISKCRIYTIVVALGAGQACKRHFKSKRGSLQIRNINKLEPDDIPTDPFTVPQFNRSEFIHIFDDENLEILMSQLDTISDFTEYLEKKEKLFHSCRIALPGEEELMALFLRNNRVFPRPKEKDAVLVVAEGYFDEFVSMPAYAESRKLNDMSYELWDVLIRRFMNDIRSGEGQRELAGINVPVSSDIRNYELGLRQLALINRLDRRLGSEFILDARQRIDNDPNHFFISRLFIPPSRPNSPFLICVFNPEDNLSIVEAKEYFMSALGACCLHNLEKRRDLISICGIGFFAQSAWTRRHGFIEILNYIQQQEWTEEELWRIHQARNIFDIPEESNVFAVKREEFPNPDDKQEWIPLLPTDSNRHARRRKAAEQRKKHRKPQ